MNELCEKQARAIEPIASVLSDRFSGIECLVKDNNEYILNITSKLEFILFPIKSEIGGDPEENIPNGENLWGRLDEVVDLLNYQRYIINELFERLEQ